MIDIILFLSLIAVICYMGYRVRTLESRLLKTTTELVRTRAIVDDCVTVLGQLTVICQTNVKSIKESGTQNNEVKAELVEFQQAMAEFAMTVTDFMDKIKDVIGQKSAALKKDVKLN